MSPPNYYIRPLQHEDAPHIRDIQAACYPEALIESIDNLLIKRSLSPNSCWICIADGEPCAYLFSHPWHDQQTPALDAPLQALPADADTLFLHDLAIHPCAQGKGIAQAMIKQALHWAHTKRFRQAMLIAVNESQHFWQRFGFSIEHTSKDWLAKKADYGTHACCLIALL